MKKLASCILLALLFVSMFTLAMNIKQVRSTPEPPAVEWSKTYGTTRRFPPEPSVVQTEDGGFAIVSTSDFGTDNEADERFWLVKTDSAGNAEWNKTYGEQREVAYSIVHTNDGGCAMVGDAIIGGYGNAWLVKTDASGNMQWNKSYTEIGWATAYTLIQTKDGGYVIAGCKEYYDGWLMKTDANGTMQWSKSFVEVNNTQLQSVVQTNDGGFVAAGATQYPPFSGKVDAYVVKTDSDGNTIWSKEFSRTTGDDYGRLIIQSSDGGYAIAGETDHFGNADFWLIKTDASGNFLWDRIYGGTGWDGANSIVQTIYGGYALAGQTNSFGAGGNDFWLVKTDAEGNVQWNETYGGAGDDGTGAVGSSVIQTSDGGYALAGYTNSFSGDGSYEVWLIKLAGPRTWIVDDDGPADFSTIQEAINAANDGDTIFVRNGTYHELVVVNKTVSLIGQGSFKTVIDGDGSNEPVITVSYPADDCRIAGFTVRQGRIGVLISTSYNNISENSIIENSYYGIYAEVGSQNNVISYNDVVDNGNGICLAGSPCGPHNIDNSIVNNEIVSNNGYGVYLQVADDNTISENKIQGNLLDGVVLEGWDLQEDGYSPSLNNTLTSNTIVGNRFGVFIHATWDNRLTGNNITDNIFGIGLDWLLEEDPFIGDYYCENNTITENTIESNSQCGILAWNSTNNAIYHNNFINNPLQIDGGNWTDIWDDGYPSGGNYWSDYTGINANSDGVGDTPYVIDAYNQDNYPLMKPYAGPHDIGIVSLSVSKTVIAQGVSTLIRFEVINYGIDAEAFNVAVYANETYIFGLSIYAVPGRHSVEFVFAWITTPFAVGSYTISAYASPVYGETDLSDNTFAISPVKITIAGDVNGDFFVNIADVGLITANWLKSVPPAPANADVNGDFIINISDVGPLATNWLKHA